jgi:hypothetical protein
MTTPMTSETYYSEEGNFGKYQYFSLKEFMDEIMLETQDDDSVIKNTKRSKLLNVAMRGIRLLSRDVANDVLAFEVTISESLVWPVPQDYVNWVRVSLVVNDDQTKSKRLVPLDVNYKIQTAVGYLQGHAGKILFDSNGEILKADSSNAIARPYKSYEFNCSDGQFTTDASKFSKYGEFTIDERRGIFVFSSNVMDQEVVIEYVSDGLQGQLKAEQITMHKYLRDALYDYVIKESIATKRNVSRSEKEYWTNKWKGSRHRAVMARADFDLLRIARSFLNQSMTL